MQQDQKGQEDDRDDIAGHLHQLRRSMQHKRKIKQLRRMQLANSDNFCGHVVKNYQHQNYYKVFLRCDCSM